MKLTSLFVHSFVGFSLLLVNGVTEVTAQQRPTKLPTAQSTHLPTNKPTRRPTKEPTRRPTKEPTLQPTKNPTRQPTKKPTRSPIKKPTRSPTKKPTHRPTKVPYFGSSKTPTQKPTLFPSTLPITSPSTPPSVPPLVLLPSQLPTAKVMHSPSASPSAKPTTQPSQSPTAKPTPLTTEKPTTQPSPSPTTKPLQSPTAKLLQLPTAKPSQSPTAKPTQLPTAKPTQSPSAPPSAKPTTQPSQLPTAKPTPLTTARPTTQPSPSPTTKPLQSPTAKPSQSPTATPLQLPTAKPSQSPTATPTTQPSPSPTTMPSPSPTAKPSQSPTTKPSQLPTVKPLQSPTAKPTQLPSASPLAKPTTQPSQSPTAKPTPLPTAKPTAKPTAQPSPSPTVKPSQSPTAKPSSSPTVKKPSTRPTALPTAKPTANPTGAPTAFPLVCTLDHYARPSFAYDVCDSSHDQIGSMCYSKCPSNYYRNPDDSSHCIHNPGLGCPNNDASYGKIFAIFANLANTNLCTFKSSYSRGLGYPWQFGNPAFDLTNAQICCKNNHPHGCEEYGLIYYPKCAPGYFFENCCTCERKSGDICPLYGLNSLLTYSCTFPVNITTSSGSLPTQCNIKRHQIGNLCYGSCPPGYTADNVTCLSAPPLGWVQCGQFAAKDSSTCSSYDKSKTYPTCSSLSLPATPIGSQRYTMLDDSQVSVNGVVGSLTKLGLVTCGFLGASSSLTIFANLVSGAYYEAVIQEDANFVVYKHDKSGNSSPIFATGTARSVVDTTAYYGVFPDFPSQSGILAIFDTSNGGRTIWTSMPYAINLGSATVGLIMQQDGNLVQYAFYPDGLCDAIWNSGLPIFNLSPTGQVVWPHF